MPLWAVLGAAAAGAGFTVGAVNLIRVWTGATRRRSRGTTTPGLVVHVDERGEMINEGMITVYIPTVEFHNRDGHTISFRNHEPVGNCPGPGGTLTIWYDPDDPSTPPEVDEGPVRGAIAIYLVLMALCAGLVWFMIWFPSLLDR